MEPEPGVRGAVRVAGGGSGGRGSGGSGGSGGVPVRLRAAVIGTGFVGPHHVDAVRRTGYAEVVVLAGRSLERTAERAANLGVPYATSDIGSLLADPSIDVVHICTPNATHVELAAAVLEAGKHLVLEKPIGLDTGTARKLVARARASGRHAAMALTYRGYPIIRQARDLAAGGALGSLRLIHGAYIQDWLSRPTDYNWRVDPAVGGASRAVADIGTHWFDTAEFVTGLRAEAVLATLATFMPQRHRPAAETLAFQQASGETEIVDIGSEDAATFLIRFEGGPIGACTISQVSPGRKNAMTIEVAGSDASLAWAQETPEQLWVGTRSASHVVVRGAEAGASALPELYRPARAGAGDAAPADHDPSGIPALPAGHPEGWGDALRDLLRPFYRAVALGEVPAAPGKAGYPTLEDGLRGLVFVEAVLASAREGRWQTLPRA